MSEKSKGVFAGVATILASFGVVVEHPQVLKVFNPIEEVVEHPQVLKVFKPIEKVVEEIHPPNAHPSLPDINEPTISKLVPSAFNTTKEVRETWIVAYHAADFQYTHSSTIEIPIVQVRKAAINAALKLNEKQGYRLPYRIVVSIATSAAAVAFQEERLSRS